MGVGALAKASRHRCALWASFFTLRLGKVTATPLGHRPLLGLFSPEAERASFSGKGTGAWEESIQQWQPRTARTEKSAVAGQTQTQWPGLENSVPAVGATVIPWGSQSPARGGV